MSKLAIATRSFAKKLIRRLSLCDPNSGRTWRQLEYFDPSWMVRIRAMAAFVPEGATVLDLGCGRMWLREILSPACTYFPVDYAKRDGATEVCDFSKYQFPNRTVDVSFISGCLEYVEDVDWFVAKVAAAAPRCIVSYCALEEFPDREARKKRAWVNHLTRASLIQVFADKGMIVTAESSTADGDSIFVFDRKLEEVRPS
jgi:hypothetical protein